MVRNGQEEFTGCNEGVSPVTEVSEENPGRFGTRLGLRGEEGFTSERCRVLLDQLLSLCPMSTKTFGSDVSRLLAFCVLLRMPSLKTLSLFRS